jgi:hypothetical protein
MKDLCNLIAKRITLLKVTVVVAERSDGASGRTSGVRQLHRSFAASGVRLTCSG